MTKGRKTRSYFAAANGFSGFRSYFKDVFSTEKNKEIYILKGGPGTGKSSFMRKLSERFKDNCSLDLIYCSSDTSSLDGVIIEKNGIRVSILDGTAPHETNPTLPGACDGIINIGESWNKNGLMNKRREIENLTSKKSEHYKSAYEYLRLAGEIDTKIMAVTESIMCLDEEEIKSLISKNKDKNEGRSEEVMLISAFGKDGYTRLSTEPYIKESTYNVTGIFESEYVFMRKVAALCHNTEKTNILFPSPFGGDKIEGVSMSDTLLLTDCELGTKIDTSKYLDTQKLSKKRNLLEFLEMTKSKLLALSRAEFLSASEAHFALEEIYSAEMDFRKNDELLERTLEEISKTLKNK